MARAGHLLALPLLLLTLVVAGCDEDLVIGRWTAVTDTATIYSLAKPQLNLLSAFNLHDRVAVPIEHMDAATQWDIALDTRGGSLVLLPPGALGVQSTARILMYPGFTFESVVDAPSDTTLYTAASPLPVVLNALYIVKTGARATSFGSECSYYAKMSPIAVNAAEGSIRFIHDSSPLCNDRRLVPPDSIQE